MFIERGRTQKRSYIPQVKSKVNTAHHVRKRTKSEAEAEKSTEDANERQFGVSL